MGAEHSSSTIEFNDLFTPGVKKVIVSVNELLNVEVIHGSGYRYSIEMRCNSKIQVEMDLFTLTTLNKSDILWIGEEVFRLFRKKLNSM